MVRKIIALLYLLPNYYLLRVKNSYEGQIPEINGMLWLRSKGKLKIGKKTRFISLGFFNMAGIERSCSIEIKKGAKLQIGNNCGFSGVSIVSRESIVIGNNVIVGANSKIWDNDFHSVFFEHRDKEEYIKRSPIIIGDNVFIGANCLILKGVNIGCNAVIGAGSVITQNIGEGEIWAGNPAKFVKRCL